MRNSLFSFDRRQGTRYVCGTDEAGRACLAGPLVAAAVRFDYARLGDAELMHLADLDDSKRRTPRQRAVLLPLISELADAAVFVVVPPGQIDRDGLDVSNRRALTHALELVAVDGSTNLVDGFELENTKLSARSLVRGDATSAAIAAASIVAKEMRDWLMGRLDLEHPGYGLAKHKGYITRAHKDAVGNLGLSPVHRQSVRFKPLVPAA